MSTVRDESPVFVDGVRITSPSKLLFPGDGITKIELVDYYQKVSGYILRYISDRPVSLVRSPEGIKGERFYQKHPGESFPDYIDRVRIPDDGGESDVYISLDEVNDLIFLSNLSVIEYHAWGSRVAKLDKPDTLIFDLDPTPTAKWSYVIDSAKIIRDELEKIELRSFVKTSGKKGLHVVIPLDEKIAWEDVRNFAEAFAKNLATQNSGFMTTEFYKKNRGDRVFIDWLRNLRGATSVAPYSVRAVTGAPVATPISWDEVNSDLKPDRYNIKNVFRRLSALKEDPWRDYFQIKQNIPLEKSKTK